MGRASGGVSPLARGDSVGKVLKLGKYRRDHIQGTMHMPGPQSIIVTSQGTPSGLGQRKNFTGNE